MHMSDFDMAVVAIHDGNLAEFNESYKNTPDKTGELLIHAAGRPGNVGRKMTALVLAEAQGISNEMYLTACKKAIDTGDADRTLMMAEKAGVCRAGNDLSVYGDMIGYAMFENRRHIAEGILNQCSPEQIKEANPQILPQAVRNRNYSLAIKLVEKGIDGNQCAAALIRSLIYNGNDRGYLNIFFDRGMEIACNNYSAMQACIITDSPEQAKLLLDRGMDFDLYNQWAKNDGYTVNDSETYNAVKKYWENEIKQTAVEMTEEEQNNGQTMGGM